MTTYAIADQVPEGCDYLTAGKEYLLVEEWETFSEEIPGFTTYDDKGHAIYCKWDKCEHLNGGNWRRVEK